MLSFIACCQHLFTYIACNFALDFQSRLEIKIKLTRKKQTNKQREKKKKKLSYHMKRRTIRTITKKLSNRAHLKQLFTLPENKVTKV